MISVQQKPVVATLLLALVILVGEFVEIPGLTKPQVITASILLLAAILWVTELVSLFVVSFLILALEIVWLTPVLSHGDKPALMNSFYKPFFSNIILLFLGGFVLSSLMQKYGLDIRFAQAILARTKGKPEITLLGIIIACAFLSMWISNTATAAMMLTIVFPLLRYIPKNHTFRIALVLSIPFACNIGGIGTPIGTPPNAIALSYLAENGLNLSFVQWMALTMPIMLVLLLVLWQLLARLYPARGLVLQIQERKSDKFTLKHFGVVIIFILTALGWFSGKAIGLSTGTVALLPIIASFWFGLLDTGDFRKLPWDILYIISGGLALGVALNLSGLGVVLVGLLPLDITPLSLLIIAAAVAAIMSTVMSNTATAGLVIPLIMSLQVGVHQLIAIVLALALMCSLAMALPVTTPPNAIAFSSRAIKTKDMMLAGSIITIVGFAVVSFIGPKYWNAVIPFLLSL